MFSEGRVDFLPSFRKTERIGKNNQINARTRQKIETDELKNTCCSEPSGPSTRSGNDLKRGLANCIRRGEEGQPSIVIRLDDTLRSDREVSTVGVPGNRSFLFNKNIGYMNIE